MELLRFTVRNQRLSGGKVRLVSDSIDYVEASFDFRTDDWSGLSKWAHFTKGETTYDVNLVNDKITRDMHLNLGAGRWEVKLHGTNEEGTMRVTTDSCFVYVDDYGNKEPGEVLPEIPISAAEQIDVKAQKAVEDSKTALEIARRIEEAAARGDFDFRIGGYFETKEELEESVETPRNGDAYCVGTQEPYLLYIWDGEIWRNNGTFGEKGEDGITPEIWFDVGVESHVLNVRIGDVIRQLLIKNGKDGKDGVPIRVKVEEIEGGNRVTFYSVSGPESIYVMNGKDGEAGNIDLSGYDKRLADVEANVADLLYVPIAVTSFGHNAGTKENGDKVNSVVLSWVLNKIPESLVIDGVKTEEVQSGSVTFAEEITSNRTFNLKAIDEREKEATKSTTIYFYDGIYYGCAEEPDSVDSEFILSLTKKLSSGKNLSGLSVTGGEGKYFWYAYPASMKESIFNIGGFDYEYPVQTVSFTNKFGVTKNYYVYKSTFPIPGSISVTVKGG